MNFKDLHNAICTTLKREISSIQTCEIYPSIRKELVAPALFVELVSLYQSPLIDRQIVKTTNN
ncbi:hypothetical protein [Wolbachia endosymbiont of Oedothorax gibbosus]|uniref:hypothetical protein n=1 Tax=Wolbachia endosymbiont of Oedothorax gibbosus TaxID=931100 RepID=UPI00202574B7|nr:hypothetical protein [Wolbachia endosymbiont of Oedothorax gibbosus]